MEKTDLQRIEHIRDYCSEIQQTVKRYGNSFEMFDKDSDYQRSVSFSILQIGELSRGLSEDFIKSTEKSVPWKAIKGMRNLVAHNYGSMSRKIIWETVEKDIPTLLMFCQEKLAQT